MFEWFSDLPGFVKVILFTSLAIGIVYGNVQVAMGLFRAQARNRRIKAVSEWKDAYRATISAKPQGRVQFFSDNAAVLYQDADSGQYTAMHVVYTATGKVQVLKTVTLDAQSLQDAKQAYDKLALDWLSSGNVVDGSTLYN